MSGLSVQQAEFCRLVALGRSGRQAYAEAYGCDVRSAGAGACRLLKRANIRGEVDRLTAAARVEAARREGAAVGAKAERMAMLWRMARDCEQEGKVADAVRAIAELNRMDGAYEPEQVRVQAVSFSFEALMEGLAGPGGGGV